MRLKENRDSWRSRAIIKRDFKHDHSEPRVVFKSHKNRLKWCRGKVGVKHEVEWHKRSSLFGLTFTAGKCLKCGKRMYK